MTSTLCVISLWRAAHLFRLSMQVACEALRIAGRVDVLVNNAGAPGCDSVPSQICNSHCWHNKWISFAYTSLELRMKSSPHPPVLAWCLLGRAMGASPPVPSVLCPRSRKTEESRVAELSMERFLWNASDNEGATQASTSR